MEPSGSLSEADFLRQVQTALRRLYDPSALQGSLLLRSLSSGLGSALDLRQVLLDAVEELKPNPSVPRTSRSWLAYQVLVHRYVDQFTQYEVANALALSIRQMRREERKAVSLLADALWRRYRCAESPEISGVRGSATRGDQQTVADQKRSVDPEMAWVAQSTPDEEMDIGEVTGSVLQVTRPLASTLGSSLECHFPDGMPMLTVQRTSFRQALVNTLSTVIRSVPSGKISITVEVQANQVVLQIYAFQGEHRSRTPVNSLRAEDLETARQLFALSGVTLTLDGTGKGQDEPQRVCVVCPRAQRIGVLVIDDNADTLQLLQRYLTGSPYALTPVRDPQRALEMAEVSRPQIVILDVMLPGIDGWEVLQRLREHPQLEGVPVIVCTILPEERLAFTLGASAFIRKPVNRTTLLTTLGRLVSPRRTAGSAPPGSPIAGAL